MYLTQPPIQEIPITVYGQDTVLERKDGITMGDFVDAHSLHDGYTEKTSQKYKISRFVSSDSLLPLGVVPARCTWDVEYLRRFVEHTRRKGTLREQDVVIFRKEDIYR